MRQWIEYAVENYRSKNSFGFQLAENLKARQIDTAIEQYARIVKPEEVVALLDTTLVKSGKSGFLLTDKYLYSSYEKEEGPVELTSLKHAAVRGDNNSYCVLEYEDGQIREMYVSVFLDVVDVLNMAVSRRSGGKVREEKREKEENRQRTPGSRTAEKGTEERLQFGTQETGASAAEADRKETEPDIADKDKEKKEPEDHVDAEPGAEAEPESKEESEAETGKEEELAIEIVGMEELEEEEDTEPQEPVWNTDLVRLEEQSPKEREAEEQGVEKQAPEEREVFKEQDSYEQILVKAEAGDEASMYKAAEMLYAGRQTVQNKKEALRWFRESAKAEYVPAMLKLMQFYKEGEMVRKNLTLSMSWAKKAAATLEPEGRYALAKAYIYGEAGTQDTDKGLKILDEMAEQGHVSAGETAAEVRREITKAKEKFNAGIRNPSTASGYYEMGIYCKEGDGYYSYPCEAVQYFQKAAEKEHVHAQYELACAYLAGEGVKKDEAESIRWLEKAASKSHKEAAELLEQLQKKQRTKQEKAEFRQCLRQAEKGDAYFQSKVAELYLQGTGVKKDIQKGIEWYEKASETDEGYAARRLAKLYSDGGLIPADEERAAYWRMVGGILDDL